MAKYVPARGVAERIELALRADQIPLHLALVVDPAARQIGRGRGNGNAGDTLQPVRAQRVEQEGVAGDRHRRLGTARCIELDAGLQVRTGVKPYLLLIVRGFREQFDAVGDLKADAAEHPVAVILWVQADAAARIIDLP